MEVTLEYQIKKYNLSLGDAWVIRILDGSGSGYGRAFTVRPEKKGRLKKYIRTMLKEPIMNYIIENKFESKIHKIKINV